MSFKSLVTNNFNYLKSQYDFRDLENGIGYIKEDLELEFHGGNGQVDINFYVRKNDDIFKPFISRSFDLETILRKISPDGLEAYPGEINGYLTENSSINTHLKYYARMLKNHGGHILQGDLKVFEKIHKRRRECAKKIT